MSVAWFPVAPTTRLAPAAPAGGLHQLPDGTKQQYEAFVDALLSRPKKSTSRIGETNTPYFDGLALPGRGDGRTGPRDAAAWTD